MLLQGHEGEAVDLLYGHRTGQVKAIGIAAEDVAESGHRVINTGGRQAHIGIVADDQIHFSLL